MGRLMALLLLTYGLLSLVDYIGQFRSWTSNLKEHAKQRRLRHKAIETNLMLYSMTGEEYYIERVKALGRS